MIEPTAQDDPVRLVADLLARAVVGEPADATRFVLATVDPDGRPSARFLLLKHVDERGFGFVTNRESRKGTALAHDPRAAIALHWSSLDVQVRAEGTVRNAPDADSDAYFSTRPRDSQIGAWASPQSRVIESRDELERRVAAVEARFAGQTVPRPPHWGLSFLVPDVIEIWCGRVSRLHDRYRYEREGDRYRLIRLAP
jgi:pyridoxamine 5'-phosphate oxidase